MSEITKEELQAMIDVQSRTATAMENIANSMRAISEQNKETVKAQTDLINKCAQGRKECQEGMCKIVSQGLSDVKEIANENKATIGKVKDDTFWIKIIFGSITFIISIALAVTQFVHWVHHAEVMK